MPLGEAIIYGAGGTVTFEPTTRPANALVSIYKSDGTVITNNLSGTISSIDTILIVAVNARSRSIFVDNAETISEGDKFVISGPTEWVKAKKIDGNQVTLWGPLRESHSNEVNCFGTIVSYITNSTEANSLFWDGRIRWEIDGVPYWTQVECTRYPLQRVANDQTISDLHPQVASILESEVDVDGALDSAHEYVLMRLGSKGRARVYPGSTEFISATGLAMLRNHYRHQASAASKELFERYSSELEREMEALLANITPDLDQDSVISDYEKMSYNTFKILRR